MTNMERLRLDIAAKLQGIERLCKEYNLGGISRLTLVGRDPTNDNMCVVVTSEPCEDSLKKAFEVAINNTTESNSPSGE
jgi:hypothetical protein